MSEERTDEHVSRGQSAVPIRVWVLSFVVVLLAVVTCGLWGLYLLRTSPADQLKGVGLGIGGPTPTPIIWTATPAPTPTAGPTPLPTETGEPSPTAASGIGIGRCVQVAGTGGYGLSLRSGPGENYARMDVALEGETFIVVDGPTPSGGFDWWKIRDLEDEEREWWVIGNFLEPAEHP